MRHHILAFLVYAGVALGQTGEIRILGLEPTVLFPNREPLRQIAQLQVRNENQQTVRCVISVLPAGLESTEDVPPGVSMHKILVPDIAAPTDIRIELKSASDGRVLATFAQTWQPQRHWKVFVVESSHEDMGYESFIYKKQHDIANYIDVASHLSGDAGRPPDGKYHYTMESLLFERNYIEERSKTAWREIVEKQIKTGRMNLMGAPSGVHSHWMDYEELARMTYPGRREAKDRWGLDLKTFMIVDNPSLSWAGCQAVADAGFQYVARWGQGWRSGGNNDYRTTKLPPLFWWKAPDGEHRVLFGWRSHYGLAFWYGQPADGYENLVELGAENVNRRLKTIESGTELGPYPYDALVNPNYTDHDIPHFDGRALSAWTQRYRYPEIRVASPTDFFEYVEKKYGAELPVLSGDLNNFSADYATIDPESQGWKRRAARLLPLADGVAAIAGWLDTSFQAPAAAINSAYARMLDYDEHSWPTQPLANDFHLFNAQWVKRNQAARALDEANHAVETSFRGLERNVTTGDAASILVFNPLAHERDDLVSVDGKFPGLVDGVTGRPVETQIEGDHTVFVATKVPAFGYKTFRVGRQQKQSTSAEDATENRFYRIRFDQKTGAIVSIFDKELNRELVDPKAPHRFNELVYLHSKTATSGEIETYSPVAAASMSGKAGAVKSEFTVKIDDSKTGAAITQTVILYRDVKRIDIVNDLKHVRSMYSDRYEDRYRENIYYAFPIDVPDFESRVEYPGGTVRPYDDQLRWGSHDYLSANRWVDTSNRDFGVTMAPWNAQIVSFGEPRYNRFSIDYKPASSHLYSYGYSNRMAGLLTLNPDDCNATLRYSFTSHAGDWTTGAATKLGWSVASPLEARVVPAGQKGSLAGDQVSFLSVDAPNVQLVTLKNSEQPGRGWIVRLVETEGKATHAVLKLPELGITRAVECNLVEDDQRPLPVEDGSVRVEMGPYSFATVRVLAGVDAPSAVAGVHSRGGVRQECPAPLARPKRSGL